MNDDKTCSTCKHCLLKKPEAKWPKVCDACVSSDWRKGRRPGWAPLPKESDLDYILGVLNESD